MHFNRCAVTIRRYPTAFARCTISSMSSEPEPPSLFSSRSFIHHVSLNVKDIERSIEFYEGQLGLKRIAAPMAYPGRILAWFDLGSGQQLHLQQSVEVPGEPEAIDTRMNHFSVAVDDIEEARAFVASLGKAPMNYGGNATFVGQTFLTDPDGHILEISQPR